METQKLTLTEKINFMAAADAMHMRPADMVRGTHWTIEDARTYLSGGMEVPRVFAETVARRNNISLLYLATGQGGIYRVHSTNPSHAGHGDYREDEVRVLMDVLT